MQNTISKKNHQWKIVSCILLVVFFSVGCNENEGGKHKKTDTAIITKDTSLVPPKRSETVLKQDTAKLLDTLATTVLTTLKANAFTQLASLVHPVMGLRFSPYGHIDTVHYHSFSGKQIQELAQTNKKIKWGIFDGSGEPIILNIHNYFKRFVYDVDFLHAEKKSFDETAAAGNTANNISEVYPQAHYIEYYFAGFKPEYGGMDWKAIRLVFSYYQNKAYLIAIVHDQWTI